MAHKALWGGANAAECQVRKEVQANRIAAGGRIICTDAARSETAATGNSLLGPRDPVSNFNAALAAIGTYLPLVRGNAAVGEVELALQASIFVRLDSSSFDFLINTDFIVGSP
jgi:hypothetical protein